VKGTRLMSREEVERLKIEEKLGLRRSQRHRNKEVDTENSNIEVDLESGEESVVGESEHSFGEFPTTAQFGYNKKIVDQKTSNTSFPFPFPFPTLPKGVLEREK